MEEKQAERWLLFLLFGGVFEGFVWGMFDSFHMFEVICGSGVVHLFISSLLLHGECEKHS